MKLKGNNLIIVNILTTYARMILVVGMGLFSTRWVLEALGKEDFGLYSVVGGLIGFMMFISGTMSNSVQRFYAYSIGQGNSEVIKRWFNTAFISYGIFSILLVILGVPIGHYLINNVMTIPLVRVQTCLWVYDLSIVGAVSSLITAAYSGMLIATQRIFELSLWGILGSLLAFCLAWYLLQASGDLLLIYAIGTILIQLLLNLIQIIRAQWLFKACHLERNYWFDKKQFKELFSFVGWDLFGGMGYMVRGVGTPFLINIFSGATVNAAYGIANQVSRHTTNITGALLGAISPEITAREGAGNRDRMISLSLRTSKLAVLLTYLWLIPLFIEIDYVLELWLEDVPEYAGTFCRIVLLSFLFNTATQGYRSAVMATGNIKKFQLTLGTILMLTFPIVWVIYKLTGSPTLAVSTLPLISGIHSLGRVYWVKQLLNVPYSYWINEVLIKSFLVLIPTLIVSLLLKHWLDSSFVFLILLSVISFVTTCMSSWFFGLDETEKDFIREKIKRITLKVNVAKK
jgi:O-antigen/teichoic acid export membrane protein